MADVRLSLSVDSSGAIRSIKTFNAEVDKVPASASKAGSGLDALTSRLDKFAAGLGIGTGIGIAVKGFDLLAAGARDLIGVLTGGAKALGTYSDKMVTLGQRTGLAVSSLQVFNAMAKTSGTDVDSLAKAAVRMEVALGKGDASFKKLGLSLSSLKAMSPDAAFAKVAESIGAIEDPMQRASAAVAIFGKSGAEMLPVFASNMEEARKKAEEFGLVLSDKTMTSAEALGDAIDTAGMAFDAFLMRLAGIVAQSPALMAAIEEMSKLFGVLSKSVDGNQSALTKWVDYGLDLAADAIWTLLFAMEKAISAFGIFGGTLGMVTKAASDYSGLTGLIEKMKAFTEQTRLAMKAKADWAAIDMGGKGVLLPGGSIPKQGVSGGGSFDNSKSPPAVKALFDEVLQKWEAQFWAEQRKFEAFKEGMFRDLPKAKDYWKTVTGKSGMDMLSDADKNRETYTFTKATVTASQALQNFANMSILASTKLGKFIAGLAGNLSAMAGGLEGLGKLSGTKALSGKLSKAGDYGQIAAAALDIGSMIFGLFKKKPKPPAPEPPKQATAEAWRNFTGGQQDKGAAGVLAGVSGIRVTSPEDMAAQASIAAQSFWAMFKQQGLIKAADAFKAVRDKMIETFKAAGASDEAIGAMLGGISTMVDLAGNEAFRGAADGANGFAQALAAIANEQLPMTVDQFRAFEQQAVAGYEQMKQAAIAQGLSSEEAIKTALQGSAMYLQTLRDAAAKYGLDLGAGTQNLMDLAGQNGIAMASDSTERLILSLNALTEALGGAPPKFEQAITNGGRNAGGDGGRDSLADAMDRGFAGLGRTIVDGIRNIPAPQIFMDTGALIGEIAEGIDRGIGSALATSLEGNR